MGLRERSLKFHIFGILSSLFSSLVRWVLWFERYTVPEVPVPAAGRWRWGWWWLCLPCPCSMCTMYKSTHAPCSQWEDADDPLLLKVSRHIHFYSIFWKVSTIQITSQRYFLACVSFYTVASVFLVQQSVPNKRGRRVIEVKKKIAVIIALQSYLLVSTSFFQRLPHCSAQKKVTFELPTRNLLASIAALVQQHTRQQ